MTESEWLTAMDPEAMLEFLQDTGRATDRKLRLFACGCCRRIWGLFPGEARSREAVIISERFADGLATKEELRVARKRASRCEQSAARSDAREAARETAGAAAYEARLLAIDYRGPDAFLAGYDTHTPAANRLAAEQLTGQAALVRDIFGNPFRPAPISPAWRTPAALKLAQAAYDNRLLPSGLLDSARLAVLADAFEEAGCTDPNILVHCRQPGPHVRGCWAVDLILGKSQPRRD